MHFAKKALLYFSVFVSLAFAETSKSPWSVPDGKVYLYVSPSGSDNNDGKLKTPKKTVKGAIDALSSLSASPLDKAIIVLLGGRYDLTEPIVVPTSVTDKFALKIRSENDQAAIITGGRAFEGNWVSDKDKPGVVLWTLDGVDAKYRSFSTLYSYTGAILPRASSAYGITYGVPFIEYLRSHPNFSWSATELDTLMSASLTKTLPQILSDLYNRKANTPKLATDPSLIKEAAAASGYLESELNSAIPVTLNDCTRQTFLFDEDFATKFVSSDALPKIEIVLLQTFESARLRLLRTSKPGISGRRIAVLARPVRTAFNGWLSKGLGYRFYLENDLGMLTAPGSWYLDRASGTLYYKLLANEELRAGKIYLKSGREAPIYFNLPHAAFQTAPLLKIGTDIDIKNKIERRPAGFAIVERLRFSYTDWKIPESGYFGSQSYKAASAGTRSDQEFLQPALQMDCDNCAVVSNTFMSVAGHAVRVKGSLNQIVRNYVYQAGANGIIVGSWDQRAIPDSNHPDDVDLKVFPSHQNLIEDNKISGVGVLHFEGTGILAYQTSNTSISRNLVEDVSYLGISLGWDWLGEHGDIIKNIALNCAIIKEKKKEVPLSIFKNNISGRNNLISRNIVRRAMTKLVDGAGIYLVGSQPGTKITSNFIHEITKRDHLIDMMYGIYLDQGTQQIEVSDNFVGSVARGALHLNVNADIVLKHNIFAELKNVRQQGAFILDASFGTLNTIYSDAYHKGCREESDRDLPLRIVGERNGFERNLFLGNADSKLILRSHSEVAANATSMKSGGSNLFFNTHILLSKSWPFPPAPATSPYSSQYVHATSYNATDLIIKGGDPGISSSAIDSTVTIGSTPAQSTAIPFGSFPLKAGPTKSVGFLGQ